MSTPPPPFAWDAWYERVGGRSIRIDAVQHYLQQIYEEQYPRCFGDVAEARTEFASPESAAAHLKARAFELGADLAGICRIEPSDIYRGRTLDATHAIAVAQRMSWREFQDVPSEASAIECLRIYYSLGEVVIALAAHIRSLGYPCTVEHPIGDSDLLHVPIGLKAGFGELGRHGSIINPQLGPLFRMGSIALTMDLAIDRPVDAGIAAFCDTCLACRKYCPAGAIPDQRSPEAGKDHLGHDRYVIDTGRCFPYFAKYHYCSICLPVCVYNHKEWARDFGGHPTTLFPAVRMHEPPAPVDVDETRRHRYIALRRV